MNLLLNFVVTYLPAMAANGAPVALLAGRKGTPIDMGRTFVDGRRVLGDGKTFEGLLVGLAAGTITALVVAALVSPALEMQTVVLTGFVSSAGAMFGDLAKSFFKRRAGLERGERLLLADQLDFFLGATLFLTFCERCVKPVLESFVAGLILIPLLHALTNYIAFKLGLKSVPW